MIVVTRDRLPRDRRLWGTSRSPGVLGTAMPFTLFGYGEERVSVVVAGIWNATTALLVLPLAVFVFRTERMTAHRAVGLLLGFVGVLVVLGVWQGAGRRAVHRPAHVHRRGGLLRLAIPYTKRFISRPQRVRARAGGGAADHGDGRARHRRAVDRRAPTPIGDLSGKAIASVLTLGALGTGIAFVLNMRNIQLVGATTASMVTYLIPVFAVLLGVLVLDEHLTWHQPVGALVVLVGVAIAQGLATRKRPSRPPSHQRPN